MIESRRQTGQWRRIAPPPGSTQSTSRLFCAAESEINRIVTLGAVPGRTLPRSKPERSPRLLNEVSTGIEYRLPPGSCRVRRWPVNYRKLLSPLTSSPKAVRWKGDQERDRKSTRLNSSHLVISYAVFCLKKKKTKITQCAVM